jgi:hypothetical protein
VLNGAKVIEVRPHVGNRQLERRAAEVLAQPPTATNVGLDRVWPRAAQPQVAPHLFFDGIHGASLGPSDTDGDREGHRMLGRLGSVSARARSPWRAVLQGRQRLPRSGFVQDIVCKQLRQLHDLSILSFCATVVKHTSANKPALPIERAAVATVRLGDRHWTTFPPR